MALEAEPASEEQQQEWRALQEECRRLALEIDRHPYWAEAPDRKAARKVLDAIAEV
ncbi:hypothetical protein ACBJ59_36680 [Nonomuraea sp. MTCD27]|uniref:hypothetical protein n=1 Tax=Nonomuraea sp. MTCD27 TaxID=1676747 RepID=UPI0035C18D31